MGTFLNSPVLSPLPDGFNWRLDTGLRFKPSFGAVIRVPSGFVTDLASIPRFFWNILPPFGKYTSAAILHDWLYRRHLGTRAQADAYLLEGMSACGVGCLPRWTIYLAVRSFGWSAWRDDERLISP